MTFAGEDPRAAPRSKGPDLHLLPGLRARAAGAGADECVFLDAGAIADGASSSLLWWRGDRLFRPAPELAQVPGTTAATIVELARDDGVATDALRTAPGELEGAEVWAVNALHGIRLVTAWIGGPSLDVSAAAHARAARWNDRLAGLRAPLSPETEAPGQDR